MADVLSSDVLESFGRFVEGGGASPPPPPAFKYYEPLEDAADDFIYWSQHPEERIYTGIAELDECIRGTAPGEITTILGFSHSGKTVVATHILQANANRRMLLSTPDETRVAVLIKLVALVHHIDSETLELRIKQEDRGAIELLRSTVRDHLPKLCVSDATLTLPQMTTLVEEIQQATGEPVEGVMFDYVDLLAGSGEDVNSKFDSFKAWGKNPAHRVPLFLLHQSSRTAGADGGRVTITSGGYGGERQSTHMIGVRRKRAEIEAALNEIEEKIHTLSDQRKVDFYMAQKSSLELDHRIHEHTLTVNLVKNKRPPMKLVGDLDYELERATGRIIPLRQGDLPQQYRQRSTGAASTMRTVQEALRQREMF